MIEELLQSSPLHRQLFLNAIDGRDQLLTKISGIDLWLYHIEENMFYVMFRDGEGHLQTNSHPVSDVTNKNIDSNNPEELRKHPLSDESQERWVILLRSLAVDTSLPEEGYIDLDYRDHSRRIRSYYRVIKDDAGRPQCVVGDSEDYNKTKFRMQQVIDEQNDYIRIINGFKATYESIVYIDLRDHSFMVLEGTSVVQEIAKESSNAIDLMSEIIIRTMKSQYHEAFRQLLQPEHLQETLSQHKYVSMEYETVDNGWLKMRIAPAEYNQQGELTHIIISTESVDEEHREKDQLRKKSEHDGLTGLYNRAAGVCRIEKLLLEEDGILVLFDCDKFKSINDTFGHLVGDKVLYEIAHTLTAVFADQVLFRLGGDEFVAFLTSSFLNAKKEEGLCESALFEYLQQEIAKIDIPEMNGQCPSLSGGGARSFHDKPIIFDELYKMADLALYQSKKYGRKKVTLLNVAFGMMS